jgi:hypothetical protein
MEIPLSFTYLGKPCKGFLSKVSGAGTPMWHLYLTGTKNGQYGDYYYGQLFMTVQGWRFKSQTGIFEDLEGWFVELVDGVERT